jgi:hypothetical protein
MPYWVLKSVNAKGLCVNKTKKAKWVMRLQPVSFTFTVILKPFAIESEGTHSIGYRHWLMLVFCK